MIMDTKQQLRQLILMRNEMAAAFSENCLKEGMHIDNKYVREGIIEMSDMESLVADFEKVYRREQAEELREANRPLS